MAAEHDDVPKATHWGELTIGDTEMPCYVLSTGDRVFSLKGIVVGLMGTQGGHSREGLSRHCAGPAKGLKRPPAHPSPSRALAVRVPLLETAASRLGTYTSADINPSANRGQPGANTAG